MLSVEEYRERVLALAGAERAPLSLPLAQCPGLVLAADLSARLAVPPFTNSAMDGYAVRATDVAAPPLWLQVVGELAAGAGAAPTVGAGQAVRVMTGGRLPAGADAVVPVEWTDQPIGAAPLPARVRIDQTVQPGRNVRRRGEDVAEGDLVLTAGTVVTPALLASAASIGYGTLPVLPAPRVAVVATGAELVEAGDIPGEGLIPDSNSVMLAALATQVGARVVAVERCGDDPAALAALLSGLPEVELVLTSGGVSAGAYEPLRQLGGGLDFAAVAMQPGKPQGCGRLFGALPVLAFPGNPVSAFVSFHVFARPLLDLLAGRAERPAVVSARASVGWESPPGRRQHVPVVLEWTEAGPACAPSHVRGSGSHLIASLHRADALAVVAEEVTEVRVGDRLVVMEV